MQYTDRIEIDPKVCNGKPVISSVTSSISYHTISYHIIYKLKNLVTNNFQCTKYYEKCTDPF